MRSEVCQKWVCLIVGMACLLIPGQALAKDGWYMAMDLGVAVAPGLNTRASDNDLRTICDQFIDSATTCTDPSNDKWTNDFDGGAWGPSGVGCGVSLAKLQSQGGD